MSKYTHDFNLAPNYRDALVLAYCYMKSTMCVVDHMLIKKNKNNNKCFFSSFLLRFEFVRISFHSFALFSAIALRTHLHTIFISVFLRFSFLFDLIIVALFVWWESIKLDRKPTLKYHRHEFLKKKKNLNFVIKFFYQD